LLFRNFPFQTPFSRFRIWDSLVKELKNRQQEAKGDKTQKRKEKKVKIETSPANGSLPFLAVFSEKLQKAKNREGSCFFQKLIVLCGAS